MTPDALLTALAPAAPEATLTIETPEGPIQGGYHVTELKYGRVTGIDCSAQVTDWEEATLELLDGYGGPEMQVGTFRKLMSHGIAGVTGIGTVPLKVEFAHANAGLRVYGIADVTTTATGAVLRLEDRRAVCKPALAAAAPTMGCC